MRDMNMPIEDYLGEVTEQEIEAYNRLKKNGFFWDVATYLGWGQETEFITPEEAAGKVMPYDKDETARVTEGEFKFMVEYIDESFNIDTTIFDLAQEAFSDVLDMRRGFFKRLTPAARAIAKRTIIPERRASEAERKAVLRKGEALDSFLFLIGDYYDPEELWDFYKGEHPDSFYAKGEEEEMLSDLLSCESAEPVESDSHLSYLELFRKMGLKDSPELLEYLKGELKKKNYPEEIYDIILKMLEEEEKEEKEE